MDARLDRIKAAFDALDTDSNGFLEADDFERLAHRIIQALGVAESAPKARALHAACRHYWQGLVDTLDQNNDGKLSLEEYAHFHEPDGYEGNVRPYAEALTSICDRDDDGYVEHADLVSGLGAVGFPVANIEGLSRALDPEGTGQVSRREWRTAIEDFFLAKGSHAVSDTLV
jgi:Ca2+-binding EF-hand superfamily protein